MSASASPAHFGGSDLSCRLDAWLAALWRQQPGQVIALAHAQRRWWPLLERAGTVVWLHPGGDPRQDFHTLPGCRPTLRARLALSRPDQARDADELLSRAALRVGGVTDDMNAMTGWLAPQGWTQSTGETLLWGRDAALGWAACARVVDDLGLQPLPAPAGWCCLASAGLRRAAEGPLAWTSRPGGPGLAAVWLQQAPLRRLQAGEPAWRLQLPAQEAHVASSELAQQRTMVWGRALTDRRGNFSLIRPWEGALSWQALLPNVRARVAEVPLYLPGGLARTARARWQGTVLRLRADLPALAEDQPAFMHGCVPSWALPKEDFCEFGTLAWEWSA